MLKFLVLDDENFICEGIKEFLSNEGFNVEIASKPSEAKKKLLNSSYDILVLDLNLPELSGIEFYNSVKNKINYNLELIIITGHGNVDNAIEAIKIGTVDFLRKPFNLADLKLAIEKTQKFQLLNKCLEKPDENYYQILSKPKEDNFEDFIAVSPKMQEVKESIKRIGQTNDTTVLITGESGTGKEIVARSIHYYSSRKDKYFYTVNCSAIPETLFESEFFGHTKNAFTGAQTEKKGLFEQANESSIFLDEIGDLSLVTQAKLLRIIEDKKIRKLGSLNDQTVDVRIISASNQLLEQMIDEKKFRFDLYQRLNLFRIHIPPLRERLEDIQPLLDFFIEKFSFALKKKPKVLTNKILDKILAYDFPGNVRELKNMIEKAFIISNDYIGPEHFDTVINTHEHSISIRNYEIEKNEKELIKKAMKEAYYKKTAAAKLLGITPQSLNRRLKKYGL